MRSRMKNGSKSRLRWRSVEKLAAGTPSTPRVVSVESAITVPPRMPPWLLP
jgi:hypothetical protein